MLVAAATALSAGEETGKPATGGKGTMKPEIIAHRGASYDAPENTTASAALAWKQNADAMEIDIYLSKDGRVMVMHDKDTSRTAGGVKHVISETDSETLRKLDCGAWKGEQFRGTKMPFLEEIIEMIPPGKRLFIEVKSGPETIEPLAKILRASGKIGQIVIISFNDCIALAKKTLPEVPAYLLDSRKKDPATKKFLPYNEDVIVKKAKDAGLNGLDLSYEGLEKSIVEKTKDAGMQMFAWTVDDPAEAKRLVDIGVIGITTNRPEFLRKALESK